MEYRSLSVVAGLICLLCQLPVALAESASVSPKDWDARLEKARILREQAASQRREAEESFAARELACHDRFRVNACRDEARRDYLRSSNQSKRLDNEGKAIERAVRKEQIASQDARRADFEARRLAEQPQREAEAAAARQAREQEIAAEQASKARQARAGEQRRAKEAAARQKRQAEHQAKVEAKMEKAARKAANREDGAVPQQ